MSLVLTAAGEAYYLRLALDPGFVPSTTFLRYKLYTNDYTPTRATVRGDLTEMSTVGTGYNYKEPWNWNTPVEGNPSTMTCQTTNDTWTNLTPPLEAYGLFVTTDADVLIAAERFINAPFVITATTDKIILSGYVRRLADEGDLAANLFEVPNVAEALWLSTITRHVTPATTLLFKFFTNDYTPIDTTVFADLTICADASFMASYTMSGLPVITDEDTYTKATLPEVVATSASFIGTIYGWVAVESGTSDFIGCARFATPIVISDIGEGVTFNPSFTLRGGSF